MAASHVTTATTIEGQMLEIAREIQELEQLIPEATRPNNLGIVTDFEANTVTITSVIPIVPSGTGGAITVTAGTYLM